MSMVHVLVNQDSMQGAQPNASLGKSDPYIRIAMINESGAVIGSPARTAVVYKSVRLILIMRESNVSDQFSVVFNS